MPIYQYLCAECGNRFQQYRKVTERSLSRCPECGGKARKLFGAVGIIFKGSGFHTTDYRKPEDKKRAEGDSTKRAEGDSTKRAAGDSAKRAEGESAAPAKTGAAETK